MFVASTDPVALAAIEQELGSLGLEEGSGEAPGAGRATGPVRTTGPLAARPTTVGLPTGNNPLPATDLPSQLSSVHSMAEANGAGSCLGLASLHGHHDPAVDRAAPRRRGSRVATTRADRPRLSANSAAPSWWCPPRCRSPTSDAPSHRWCAASTGTRPRSRATTRSAARGPAARAIPAGGGPAARVRWSARQRKRWGSCTPSRRTIRVSALLRGGARLRGVGGARARVGPPALPRSRPRVSGAHPPLPRPRPS